MIDQLHRHGIQLLRQLHAFGRILADHTAALNVPVRKIFFLLLLQLLFNRFLLTVRNFQNPAEEQIYPVFLLPLFSIENSEIAILFLRFLLMNAGHHIILDADFFRSPYFSDLTYVFRQGRFLLLSHTPLTPFLGLPILYHTLYAEFSNSWTKSRKIFSQAAAA